ncbi:MAG: hypothetical protein K0S53_2375 [Bacteroidetes bacterium]|jgi:hypothetical protein|nr:hypothetical protein [Bacteroidota bacterium]MDF2451802.1 hypothetical protein [Bacteroidota bacterium]
MEIMNKLNKHLLIAAVTLSAMSGNAREKYGNVFRTATAPQRVLAGCSPAQSSAELAVNNVRTIIFSGSDMWWDMFGTTNAWYLVPKVEDRSKGANSNFAGNVWFGGLDVGGQLKIAAQTYRQSGVDFWTGPLSTQDATISSDVCNKYDKIFRLKRSEVDAFVLEAGPITAGMRDWPGNGDISLNQSELLAPFVDINGDNRYVPEEGDYPFYDVYNTGLKDNLGVCKARVFGDETLWWVYNDNGNNHIATGGKAIGMEIRAQAFAFKTTDEVNNMTFYNYQLVNRSSFALLNTYMTVWTDADMGYYGDDYIGCDVKRGLGYIYNSVGPDPTVGTVIGYGAYVPALGCDFFQGPINTTDTIDNDNDGQTDEPGEQMGMTKFLYFNNAFPGVPIQTTDPDNAAQYYQYMTGYWRDGTPFTCGGNGYGGSIPTSFVYPADTYTSGVGSCGVWNESTVAGDRRFMQSSGPFTLLPGAVNYITVGLPWARTTSTDPKASIPLLKIADDKAQALFDNCFRVLSGPEAPDLTIQELENELIIYFSNKPASNNYLNQYKELDVSIIVDQTHFPPTPEYNYYKFEGYKLYQLKNNLITQEELIDPSKAKLIFNCDVKNGVTRLVNYEYDAATGGDVPRVKIDQNDLSDKGIKSSFHFTKDEFATSQSKKVVNNKEYYFFCVAYGYNQYGEYKEDQIFTTQGVASSEGQKKPYLEGRKSKKAFGIPHNPAPEKSGSIMNSAYGYGPKVTRLEGQGNGGNNLELTQESVNDILNSPTGRQKTITYENGRGPIGIKVVDPLNVPNSEFTLKLISRNYFYRGDTLTGSSNAVALNNYINSVIDADPCKTSTVSVMSQSGPLPPHSSLPFPKLTKNSNVHGQVNQDTATWVLTDLSTQKKYYSCKSIRIGEEYYFSDLGLSVSIGGANDIAHISSPFNPATDRFLKNDDIISASMSFANSNETWLSGVPDVDGENAFNWIRSGPFRDDLNFPVSDYQMSNGATGNNLVFVDENQYFENVLGGTWAPYPLVAASKAGVASTDAAPGFSGLTNSTAAIASVFDLRALASVDIVLTKDKSKWTRCLVLEESDEPAAIPTKASKLETRRHKSVDKQGIALGDPGCNTAEASYDSLPGIPFQTGLSWFPGYAINLETGERLNIAFGEDSYQIKNNGDDMMWNPNDVVYDPLYNYSFGGRHYIYVFGNNRSGTRYAKATTGPVVNQFVPADLDGKLIGSGTYADFHDFAYTYKWGAQKALSTNNTIKNSGNVVLTNTWADAMWVNIPITINPRYNFKNPADMPGDAKVSLRVKKAYRPSLASHAKTDPSNFTQAGYVTASTAVNSNNYCPVIMPVFPYSNASGTTISGANNFMKASTDTVTGSVNNNYNLYSFNTSDIFTEINNADKLKSALDLINIVPNPYYAYSTYETGRIDNRVRITNLPNRCKIKIFTLNGTLVRTFDRDLSGQEDINVSESEFIRSKRLPFQDWDMKNQSGISVASGLYIIHIDVPGVGEKILKWFGVMRPLDLQSY